MARWQPRRLPFVLALVCSAYSPLASARSSFPPSFSLHTRTTHAVPPSCAIFAPSSARHARSSKTQTRYCVTAPRSSIGFTPSSSNARGHAWLWTSGHSPARAADGGGWRLPGYSYLLDYIRLTL
ncbi:hypothetical protein T492DRAFT_975234 [Pavlovales sp. CCMP2436]|nr:hypothetical protein T492DRAFT_975234 [Pavlovales sp. CCMP2436]